ncbi:hypothetical protein ACQ4PT_066082 [Festuca glaucescens]
MSISTMVINGDSEMGALLRRQQELVRQLRALILPALHQADGRSAELAINLLDEVTYCIAGIISRLQLSRLPVGSSKAGGPAVACNLDDRTINNVGQKRRRNNIHRRYSRSIVTISPHYDGHYWRIYGQKRINGRQHARSYYRCAYKERNCSASKTIQQQDPDGTLNNDEETAKYNVVYYGHHSCMLDDNSGSGATKEARSDLIPSGQMAGGATYFQEFDHGDLDVPALLQVLDDSQLDWDILC